MSPATRGVRGSARMPSSSSWIGGRRHRSLFVRAREKPEAFGDVYLAYYEPVLRFMARRTFDPEVAFDLMAETFTQMLANIHRFEGDTEAHGQKWMWTIARNQLYQWHESGRVEKRNWPRIKIDPGSPGSAELERIEELADLEPLRHRVRQALEGLAAEPRAVLTMRVINEWSYDEVAEELGVTINAARLRVSRALRELQKAIDDLGEPYETYRQELLT
jgi:RNA polymerase sigma factor (sigma-70 family)